MKDTELIIQAFKSVESKIERLKQIESELNSLNTRGFEGEVRSIRSKLKKPQRVDEVSQEFASLKRNIEARKMAEGATIAEVSREGQTQRKQDFGGDIFGDISKKYDIDPTPFGGGGFADVHKATRKEDGRVVAIKIPRFAKFATLDLTVVHGFEKEAHTWSTLHHPNIVEFIEYGTKPYPWISMEYVENGSLRQRIGHLSLKETLDIAIHLCDALYHAHHVGVFHQDIKPENILFDSKNNPKLTDWGLGKWTLDTSRQTGFVGMTPPYSSPEQVKPSEFGKTSFLTDIFQCGVVLYEMVTGQLPFKGEGPFELSQSITSSNPPKLIEINPRLPTIIDSVIDRCLAKKQEDRYKDISAMEEALKDIRKRLQ